MSRFKFRLWNKRKSKMISADEATHDYTQVLAIGLHGLPIAVDRDSFKPDGIVGWNVEHYLVPLQFTGLLDKNGREIWEGDIVTHSAIKHTGPVVYRDDMACFAMEYGAGVTALNYAQLSEVPWEIIGNIYEHPELAKEHDNG